MKRTEHIVSFAVRVSDHKALFHAAIEAAKKDGYSRKEYENMRRKHPGGRIACDLIMVMDNFTAPPGTSVIDSEVENR